MTSLAKEILIHAQKEEVQKQTAFLLELGTLPILNAAKELMTSFFGSIAPEKDGNPMSAEYCYRCRSFAWVLGLYQQNDAFKKALNKLKKATTQKKIGRRIYDTERVITLLYMGLKSVQDTQKVSTHQRVLPEMAGRQKA